MAEQKTEEQVLTTTSKRMQGIDKKSHLYFREIHQALSDMVKELPEGKVKTFFETMDRLLDPIEKFLTDKVGIETLTETLRPAETALVNLWEGRYPKQIPEPIIIACKARLSNLIFLAEGFARLEKSRP